MSAQDNAKLIQAIVDAYNAGDFNQFTAAADNCEVVDIPSGVTHHGPAGYKRFVNDLHTAFPGGKIEVTNLQATDQQVLLEFIGRGTHTGPLTRAADQLPATGKKFEVQFCNIYEMSNGKIAKVRTYYDGQAFSRQIGVQVR